MKFRQAKKLLKKRVQVTDVKGPPLDKKGNRLAPIVNAYIKYPPRYNYQLVYQAWYRKCNNNMARLVKKLVRKRCKFAIRVACMKYHFPIRVEK